MSNLMLKGRIVQKYGSLKNFMGPIGLSYPTIIGKLNGSTDWTVPEVQKICRLLEIEPKDIPDYFFSQEVEKK